MTKSYAGFASPLSSDRLQYRVLQAADVSKVYVDWLNDAHINQYLESRFTRHTLAGVTEFVEAMYSSNSQILWGAFLSSSGEHIGNIKLGPTDFNHLTSEIGLMIGATSAWGAGYATEMIRTVSMFGFSELGLRRIGAGCYADNIGSQKAFEKVGYTIEGRRRSAVQSGEGVDDLVVMGLLKNDL